ncbi:hypothetical protein ACFWNK_03890 [Streptomyces sp. NPDC058417]|uniref:hypothetical protein n=1 Tax=unclassified Streptomyces TaxID=2593676 RepID=UPI00365FC5AE
MTDNPETEPDPTTAGGAAALLHHLEGALHDAGFTATLRTHETALKLTLYSNRCPYTGTAEAATEWLHETGVDATAALDEDTYQVVLTLRTVDSVRTLIATLLQPWIEAHSVAQQLDDVLSDHGLDSVIDVRAAYLDLRLAADEFCSAVALARLLGAPAVEPDFRRRRGVRRFTEQLQWLLVGAVGSPVLIEAEPGCAHEVDQLTVKLRLDQAPRLTQRLGLVEVEDPAARLQRLLHQAVGGSVYVANGTGHTPDIDLLTITMPPEQGRRLMNHLHPTRDTTPSTR